MKKGMAMGVWIVRNRAKREGHLFVGEEGPITLVPGDLVQGGNAFSTGSKEIEWRVGELSASHSRKAVDNRCPALSIRTRNALRCGPRNKMVRKTTPPWTSVSSEKGVDCCKDC